MKEIKFYGKYAKLIADNNKTQTIRLWTKCNLKTDDIVVLNCKTQNFQAKIVNIENILYSNLTNEIALFDGFKTLQDLQKALQITYPNINQNSNIFVIRWELL